MARNHNWYSASDYAGLTGGRYSFYFGYEETVGEEDDEEWCFVARDNRKEILRLTASEIGWEGGDPTEWGLMSGISIFLSRIAPAPKENSK